MNYQTMTDEAICKELGSRFKRLRLRKNITQKEIAERTQLSLKSIQALEGGSGKLSTIVAVLREMGSFDQLENFIPEPGISPLALAKSQGKQRQRAYTKKNPADLSKEKSEW